MRHGGKSGWPFCKRAQDLWTAKGTLGCGTPSRIPCISWWSTPGKVTQPLTPQSVAHMPSSCAALPDLPGSRWSTHRGVGNAEHGDTRWLLGGSRVLGHLPATGRVDGAAQCNDNLREQPRRVLSPPATARPRSAGERHLSERGDRREVPRSSPINGHGRRDTGGATGVDADSSLE